MPGATWRRSCRVTTAAAPTWWPWTAAGNIVLVPDRLVALVGVRDLVVVDTPDALLVCRKAEAQRIKEIISRLEDQGRSDLL